MNGGKNINIVVVMMTTKITKINGSFSHSFISIYASRVYTTNTTMCSENRIKKKENEK